jgi:hypothetical protein
MGVYCLHTIRRLLLIDSPLLVKSAQGFHHHCQRAMPKYSLCNQKHLDEIRYDHA